MVEELGSEIGQSDARVRNDGHGHPRLQRVFRDDGNGPARDRIAGERVPIAVEARDGDEERPVLHAPRVIRDLAHVECRRALGHGDLGRLEQRAEPHRRSRLTRRSAAVYAGSARRYAL